MYKDKVVLITGDAHGIGKATRLAFEKQGAFVYGIDIADGSYFKGDIANLNDLEQFVSAVTDKHPHIDIIINNALPQTIGIHQGNVNHFINALSVGVVAPFYLVQLCLPYLKQGSSIINLASTRAFQSQPETESYAAAKGAITALTHSLAISLSQDQIRVNAVAPGWIDTMQSTTSLADIQQIPSQMIGQPDDVANLILYLCSEQARFINGQTIQIDGGMSKQMIYHDDFGWQFNRP